MEDIPIMCACSDSGVSQYTLQHSPNELIEVLLQPSEVVQH